MKAILNNVVFTWIDDEECEFTTPSGFVISRKLDKTRPRWGKVVAIGPDVHDISVGEYILPEKTHEPFGCTYDGTEYWMTYTHDILLASQDITDTYSLNGDDIPRNDLDMSRLKGEM